MKLKICPFCGSEALMTYGEVFCPNKNCIIGTMIFSKTTWNTRPAEQELLEALKWSFNAMIQDINLDNGDSMFKTNLRAIKQLIESNEVKG